MRTPPLRRGFLFGDLRNADRIAAVQQAYDCGKLNSQQLVNGRSELVILLGHHITGIVGA